MSNEYTAPFYLISREGKEYIFDTLKLLHDYCRDNGVYLGRPRYWTCVWNFGMTPERYMVAEQHTMEVDGANVAFGWIVRDSRNRPIPPEEIEKHRYTPTHDGWWSRRDALKANAERLGLPIPGTGKGRGFRHAYRIPSHMSKYRAHAALEADRATDDDYAYNVKYFKTNRQDLPPNAWDDVARNKPQQSWKKSRRTRWRQKGTPNQESLFGCFQHFNPFPF